MLSGSRRVFVAGLIVALGAVLTFDAASAPGDPPVAHLEVGDSVFWDGGDVTTSLYLTPETCGVTAQCWDFPISLGEGGAVLRAAFDFELPSTPRSFEPDKGFTVEILDPEDDNRSLAKASQLTGYSAEAFLCFDPDECPDVVHSGYSPRATGMYTIRVRADSAQNWHFHMRAKLEPETHADWTPGDRLPNLRSQPPLEFGFVAPASMFGPAVSHGDTHPLSCTPLDNPEDPIVATQDHCLRFSAGPFNSGRGPVDLRGVEGLDGSMSPAAFQHILQGSGGFRSRRAGNFEWHGAHAHWHFLGYLTYEILSVEAPDDPDSDRPDMARVGYIDYSRKVGACPEDERLVEWHLFNQAPADDAMGRQNSQGFAGTCQTPTLPGMYLSSGWGDFYEWQRAEQFISFPYPDGRYIVRTGTDTYNQIVEENESDNYAYALIKVTGDQVRVIERGFGLHPWHGAAQPVGLTS